jgi:hypothetical protein
LRKLSHLVREAALPPLPTPSRPGPRGDVLLLAPRLSFSASVQL